MNFKKKFYFCGSFLPSRIRIHWPDWIRIQSGSRSATLVQAETPQLAPSPRIWAHMWGRYLSARINSWLHLIPMRIRMVTLIWILCRFIFSLWCGFYCSFMRIRIRHLIKIIRICNYQPTEFPRLQVSLHGSMLSLPQFSSKCQKGRIKSQMQMIILRNRNRFSWKAELEIISSMEDLTRVISILI